MNGKSGAGPDCNTFSQQMPPENDLEVIQENDPRSPFYGNIQPGAGSVNKGHADKDAQA